MARPTKQDNKWEFTVTQEQITHNGKKLPFFGNFRQDTGECLGVTTDSYGLVQNSELVKAAKDALAIRGLTDYKERFYVTGQGQRMYAEFSFENKQLASQVGDVFGYKLTLQNSFDRTKRAAFVLGLLRLACKNGAVTLEKEFNATAKHSSAINIKFIADALDRAIKSGGNALKVFDEMAQVNITDEQGKNILDQLVEMGVISAVIKEQITKLWLNPSRQEDRARNLYNLYNAVTEHLTHDVSQVRYEYANKVNRDVLFRLVNASRNKDTLAKLILPVPKPEVKVTVDLEPVAVAAQAGVVEAEIVSEPSLIIPAT